MTAILLAFSFSWAVMATSLAAINHWDRSFYRDLWQESEQDVAELIALAQRLLPVDQ